MSERYPGGFISKNAPTVSTSGAQGVWTLEQQAAYQKAGQWPFGGPFNYIEDVFSTYLYTGNGGNQTITNGIDVKTSGGLIWAKSRSGADDHRLWDTSKGGWLVSNTTGSSQAPSININNTNTYMYATTSGFAYGVDSGTGVGNDNGTTYASWTFRKQPKFFDVVTYTGSGATQAINHNLGSTPGCIIIKNYNPGNTDWTVYHRSLGTGAYLQLNNSNASVGSSAVSAVSSTTFTVAGGSANWNSSGQSYVAYLFAHDAGGFGTAGTDNVISCGSFTAGNTTTPTVVNLGFEPQWVLIKRTTGGDPYYVEWRVFDVMRGMPNPSGAVALYPNSSSAESSADAKIFPTATGFSVLFDGVNISGNNFIYIAIRRGPMKTPTSGTSVFEPAFATANSPEYKSSTVTSGFDTAINIYRPGYSDANFSFPYTATRLQGPGKILFTSNTKAEYTYSTAATFAWNTGWFNSTFGADSNRESYMFKRAPGFHDVVCYTGTGSSTTVSHNLGVTPEIMIVKSRNLADTAWSVYTASQGAGKQLYLQSTAAVTSSAGQFDTAPTASVFSVGGSAFVNEAGYTYVAYLFASCPGVSKVGSYTGTGANQTIDCGFPSGVRFVLIKRTNSTGDWYVYDTTRGMTSGTDPYILLNSVAAEVTGTNYVETIATGFRLIGSNAGTNASGGSYIYLAIA